VSASDAPWERVAVGCSRDEVAIDRSRRRYRKRGGGSVLAEARRLEWLAGRSRVPAVLSLAREGDTWTLVTEALPGVHCDDPAVMARALRSLHAVPIDDCPFDSGWDALLAEAASAVAGDRVGEIGPDDEIHGHSPGEVLSELLALPPPANDLVLVHGDACVPNVLVEGSRLSGFVDVGRAGIGCRAFDLALASRSLDTNLGAGAGNRFLEAYGASSRTVSDLRRWRLANELT
jgi:kanamycin kinase/aminoglycoside 3'-phosphotransferase-2